MFPLVIVGWVYRGAETSLALTANHRPLVFCQLGLSLWKFRHGRICRFLLFGRAVPISSVGVNPPHHRLLLLFPGG
jgi:hypothetical protein